MCGCGGSSSSSPAPAGPLIKSTKYDLVLASGRVLSYLTAVERDAAAAFYGIDTTATGPDAETLGPTDDTTSGDESTQDTVVPDETPPTDSNTNT